MIQKRYYYVIIIQKRYVIMQISYLTRSNVFDQRFLISIIIMYILRHDNGLLRIVSNYISAFVNVHPILKLRRIKNIISYKE